VGKEMTVSESSPGVGKRLRAEEEKVEEAQKARETRSRNPRFSLPYGFWLVRWSVSSIVIVFAIAIVAGVWLGVFNTAAQILAAMTAAFTVIGSLAGAYFGVKSGLDGQDKLNEARDREREQ
jgi:hypothetical protein